MKPRTCRNDVSTAIPAVDVALVRDLLVHGRFKEAAQRLQEVCRLAERVDGLVATTLAAAERVALARQECHTEAEWHSHARHEVSRRGEALDVQLNELLNLASGRLGALRRHDPAPVDARDQRAWQRVETALQKPTTADTEPAPAVHQRAPLGVLDAPRGEDANGGSTTRGQPADDVAVYCLGRFRLIVGLQPIDDWNGHKALSVFKYLLIHRRVPIPKESLAEVFWPDAEPEAARRNLHQAIYSLRQTLRRVRPSVQPVFFENECYHLPLGDWWLDCAQFESKAQSGRQASVAGRLDEAAAAFGEADALYQGNLLEEDCSEAWSRLERERLRDLYFEIADWLVTRYVERGQPAAAIALAQKVLARDACHEPAYRWLMACYLHQGQRHLAIRQFQSCIDALRRELDIGPSEETVSLYKRVIGERL